VRLFLKTHCDSVEMKIFLVDRIHVTQIFIVQGDKFY